MRWRLYYLVAMLGLIVGMPMVGCGFLWTFGDDSTIAWSQPYLIVVGALLTIVGIVFTVLGESKRRNP